MKRAASKNLTPKVVESFLVDLGNGFRLGITVQRVLHRVFWEWETDHGFDGMIDRILALGFDPFKKAVDSLSSQSLVYFDWNCGNMGVTATSKFQLIDFACCLQVPFVKFREVEKASDHFESFLPLWCRAISFRSMQKSWQPLARQRHDFLHGMYAKARQESDRARTLCRDFLVEYAVPDTDVDQLLIPDIFNQAV